MVSAEQAAIVTELVDDAIDNGAERLCGGEVAVPGSPGNYIAPTVLTGVTHEMRIMREEIFGPVLPIVVAADEEEALELANDSEFGLGASVWTRDRRKGERMARRIRSGMVWINDHAYTHAAVQCAWGGVKDSGLGRSHSKFGFYECAEIKTVIGTLPAAATSGGIPTTTRSARRSRRAPACSTAATARRSRSSGTAAARS